jgi:hypothetical protein
MRGMRRMIAAVFLPAALFTAAAQADPVAATKNFAVMRNGEQIGTNTISLRRDGRELTVQIVTHIVVKIAFVPVYRFDQSEIERWVDGRLVGLTAVTDDNGTVHRVKAVSSNGKITVEADGKTTEVAGNTIPVSLWSPMPPHTTMALNPQDGSVMPIAIVDRGEEDLLVQGRPQRAHHYSINSTFKQDVWYDEQRQLLKVELKASDGSKIEYQPG